MMSRAWQNKIAYSFTNRKKPFLILIFSFLLIMLISSGFTSPLYPYYQGNDSSIFMLIGRGMDSGKIVYKDLFDHKGPLLFLINACGYAIQGRFGIWLFQCFFGCVSITAMYQTLSLITGNNTKRVVCCIIASYMVFFFTFFRGNLSEEYSLPFISISLYLFTKYALEEHTIEHPQKYAYLHGICLMCIVFLRMNNAVSICAGLLVIAIRLLKNRKFKNFFFNILFGFLGCATVAVPFILYFIYHDALQDMIYATFLYNFKYASLKSHREILTYIKKYVLLYFPIVLSFLVVAYSLFSDKKQAFLKKLLLVIIAFNVLNLSMANIYSHYFTVFVPVYGICVSFCNTKKLKTGVYACTLLYLALSLYSIGVIFKENIFTDTVKSTYTDVRSSMAIIPEAERNSVIGYEIPTSYYLYADIIPAYKYYTSQEWWSTADPTIMQEFLDYLKTDPPQWVVTQNIEINNEEFTDILNSGYTKEKEDSLLIYYHKK